MQLVLLGNSFILALFITFVIIVLTKVGLRDFLRNICDKKKGFELFAEAIDCNFCFGFWLSLFCAVWLSLITEDNNWLICPFLAAPLIRFLL